MPTGLGSSAFARRYLRNLIRFLFLWLLGCFGSPGRLRMDYFIHPWVARYYSCGVPPFGYPGIKAPVQLPQAFRRLRALLRQSVPRHSSRTFVSSITPSLDRTSTILNNDSLDASLLLTTIQLSRFYRSPFRTLCVQRSTERLTKKILPPSTPHVNPDPTMFGRFDRTPVALRGRSHLYDRF